MKDEKKLEDDILGGFLKRLEALPDFPREVLGRLQQLGAESKLEDPERVLSAIREGVKQDDRKPNSPS